jgi:hypothetical protein
VGEITYHDDSFVSQQSMPGSLLGGSLIDGFLIELDNINSVFIGISALMVSLQSLLMTSAGDVLRRKQMYIG